MSDKIFKVGDPDLRNDDAVRDWQRTLLSHMHSWGWKEVPLAIDGNYGPVTRSFSRLVLKGHGIAQSAMDKGITPALRIKVRNKRLSVAELARKSRRTAWRVSMRKKFRQNRVAVPVRRVITDLHGFGPGHDGIDIICPPNEPLHAICDGVIRRVSDDWWGLGNPGGSLGDKGDGIIILECTISSGPFRPGLKFGYGHAEHPQVKVGDRVKAGQIIGLAGFANAWHPHFMVNDDPPVNGFYKGVGDRDPRPFLDHAEKHS